MKPSLIRTLAAAERALVETAKNHEITVDAVRVLVHIAEVHPETSTEDDIIDAAGIEADDAYQAIAALEREAMIALQHPIVQRTMRGELIAQQARSHWRRSGECDGIWWWEDAYTRGCEAARGAAELATARGDGPFQWTAEKIIEGIQMGHPSIGGQLPSQPRFDQRLRDELVEEILCVAQAPSLDEEQIAELQDAWEQGGSDTFGPACIEALEAELREGNDAMPQKEIQVRANAAIPSEGWTATMVGKRDGRYEFSVTDNDWPADHMEWDWPMLTVETTGEIVWVHLASGDPTSSPFHPDDLPQAP
jgi:hypothetical protein